MKKLICVLAAICCIAAAIPVHAENSRAACVLEMQTGDVVYEKNSVERLPMASTTKIMTCITALDNSQLTDVVTVSHNAAITEGSSAYIEEGNQLSMYDMLFGLMLNSGNDAAVAIAEHISGSVDAFVELMNQKADEIGAKNTHFTNPNGLPDPDHYTTAYDLAVITRYAMQNQTFREIVGTIDFNGLIINTGGVLPFHNHNRLLSEYPGCIGVKTGYTDAAGRCLVTAATRDEVTLIAVTLNDNDDWNDHKAMLDEYFPEYSAKCVVHAGDSAPYSDYDAVYAQDFYAALRSNADPKIKVRLKIPSKLNFPVAKGEKIGYAEFVIDNEVIGTVDVCSANDIYEAMSFGERFKKRMRHLWNMVLL